MRYDASSLVVGDVIRVQEGDVIPADAVVVKVLLLSSSEENVVMEDESNDNVGILQEVSSTTDLLVDHSKVTGERILQRISRSSLAAPDNDQSVSVVQLYWGGRVVQGSALAVVTATGSNTLVAQLIRDGKFPVRIKPDADVDDDSKAAALEDNVEEGVSLMTRRDSRLS
jgi:magnesium-transporting ATPase (P-type)